MYALSYDHDPPAAPFANGRDAAILKAVVRGERAVEDLKTTRIWLNARRGFTVPASHAVCAADLAEGIVNLKDDPVALEELASAIVAVSGLLALEDEHADRLISRVWDLALGVPLAESTIRLANAVRSRIAGQSPVAIAR
jgi:hypothetical protein